jgi:hypothetical protein
MPLRPDNLEIRRMPTGEFNHSIPTPDNGRPAL